MNILSLDMSTKSTGYAIYKHNKLVQYNYITATSNDLFNRIKVMMNAINKILQQNPDLEYVVMEEVRQQGFINVKTYKALMYLQGCIQMMIHQKFKHLQTDFLYPSSWRKICQIKQGRGIQRKQQKQLDIQWVKDNFNIIPENDDVADAIGLGYGYINK